MSNLRDELGLAPQSLVDQLIQFPTASAFDNHHAPELAVMDKCVHCGFCLPACPTYTLWGDEMDSPRGRIWMMRKALTGEATLDQTFQLHIDNCLGCMACMTACPSGVEYNKLIEDTRGQVERHTSRTIPDKLFRAMLFATFPHPTRLKLLGIPLAIYQKSGLQTLVRKSGLLNLLPARLRSMETLLPQVPLNPFHTFPEHIAPTSALRGRVGMLTGCVQDAYFAHVNAATARVLSAEGYEVIIPSGQGCCGALLVHSGHDDQAAAYAREMIATFERARVDTIVINSAGCGSTMKEYGHLLRDDPEWHARAEAFSARCKDISEILAAHPPQSQRSALDLRVAYHVACHLRHAQAVYQQPRTLLAQIPGVTVAELAEASLCCGSAGVYNLLNPETAEELGDRKVQHILDANVQALISANPGCLLQLMSSLRRNGHAELPTFHMVELLDASIRGLTADQLLHNKRSANLIPTN
ncbi:MAG: heterodisulfide reductase-related iron-sulfur binding cluster [Acidobacteriota bacterium]